MSEYINYVPTSEINKLPEVRSPIIEARIKTTTPKEDRLNNLTPEISDLIFSIIAK